MVVVGCDIGSLTAKAVVIDKNKILSSAIIRVELKPEESAEKVISKALDEINISLNDIEYCVGTGYGRKRIPFANKTVSELSCHAKGAHWLFPSARTLIDIGGQDAKVMHIENGGKIGRYVLNEKCSAGTGRFIDLMSDTLKLKLEDFGPLSLKSKNPVTISSQCSVFAETEVISLLNEKDVDLVDLVAGINRSLAQRVSSLVRRVGVIEDVVFSGGVAKNDGVAKALEDELNVKIKRPTAFDPQLIGALGAALIAQDSLEK